MQECEGHMAKVPKMDPDRLLTNFWEIVGRIMSHSFVLFGIFPIELNFASMAYVLSGKVSTEALIDHFLLYLPEEDGSAILTGLTEQGFPSVRKRLVYLFSSHKATKLPTSANLKRQIIALANYRLLAEPVQPLLQLKAGLSAHGILWHGWTESVLAELYDQLKPDGLKVGVSDGLYHHIYIRLKKYALYM